MTTHGSYGGPDGRDEDANTRAAAHEDPHRQQRITHEGAVYHTFWEDVAPYIAEVVCTFFLTMTFLCNYSTGADPIWGTTSNAFMMICLIYAFAHVSGGTMNPSICIALCLSGRFSVRTAVQKSLAQFLGATIAALIHSSFSDVHTTMGPLRGITWGQVTSVEILYTAMICFVYLNCASSQRNNPLGDPNGFIGLAVGCCFIAGGYAARDIAHIVMNSAVSVGLGLAEVMRGTVNGSDGLWYVVLDISGAFLGGGLYRIVRPQEFTGSQDKNWIPSTTQKVAAEFLGTFFIVLTKALNRFSERNTMGPEAWAVAASLTAMVYSLRDISGGYFNPAVSISVSASGRGTLTWRTCGIYCVTQTFAALVAASVYGWIKGSTHIDILFNTTYPQQAVGISEALFSFLTSYVVLTTSTVKATSAHMMRRRNIAGWAYGSCHTVGGFAIGNISGSVLNPAVAVAFTGLSLVSHGVSATCIQYILYEIVGGLFATGAFFITHIHLYKGDEDKMSDAGVFIGDAFDKDGLENEEYYWRARPQEA